MRQPDKISLLIIDAHAMFVEGLSALLTESNRFEIAGICLDATAGLQAFKDLTPHIILISDSIEGIHIINTIHEIRLFQREARIVVLGECMRDFIVIEALRAGVVGYIAKHNSFSSLERALYQIHQGQSFFCERVSQILARELLNNGSEISSKALYNRLTVREREVLISLLDGKSIIQIANTLNISRKTVTTHKSKIFQKFNVTNMVDLVRIGAELGL